MSNFVNIPLGIKTTTQIPLNIKEFAGSEALLKDLGLDNNLAFTYHKDLEVTCLAEGTKWIWREVQLGEENTGLLDTDFTYPPDLIAFGVDYSNKKYNFFSTAVIIPHIPLERIDEGNGNGIIIRGRDPLNYGSVGLNAIDLSFSDSASSTIGATADYTFSVGLNNTSSSLGAFTAGRNNIASQDDSVAMGQSNQAINTSTICLGNFSIASGGYSVSIGNGTKARSWGETAVGNYNTDYTPGSTSSKVLTDRAFVVGNGSTSFFPSDAFIVLKNGLATLPSVTNALITAGSNKAIITREYLESIDANVLHKSLNESFIGVKSSTNTGAASTNGISLTNNGTGNSYSLLVTSSSTGIGEYVLNNGTGIGIRVDNSSNGFGISLNNTGLSSGIYVSNDAGIGIQSQTASTGTGISSKLVGSGIGIVSNVTTAGTGFAYVGQNNDVNTFTVNKLGDVTANKFIKTGGTASQYLMADGSVSTASSTIQSVVVTWGWGINFGNVVDTTIGSGKTIINVIPTLICKVANNGYAIGDVVNISATQANDSGGLADSGVGIRFVPSDSTKVTFNVNDRIDISNCYNGAVSTGGAITDPVSATPVQWDMRLVIFYI